MVDEAIAMAAFGVSRHNYVGIRAPDFPGKPQWLNSLPLTLAGLRGRVVLIDFWTYSCVNCLRTLPYLKEWHRRYSEKGLVIIGVHTPEFGFEKSPANVERFVQAEGIDYPVVLDNNRAIWTAYANRYWPRKHLIDAQGIIRYDHAGEGAYQETELKIQELLRDINPEAEFSPPKEDDHALPGAVCYPVTPELYCGYDRGFLGNEGSLYEGELKAYADPGFYEDGKFYLNGAWLSEDEYLAHEGEADDGYLALRYHGLEVNAVLEPTNGPAKILVTRDARPLGTESAGTDITVEKGRSAVNVAEPRMYNLIDDWEFGAHILRLRPQDAGFRIYAFTFGGCPKPWSA